MYRDLPPKYGFMAYISFILEKLWPSVDVSICYLLDVSFQNLFVRFRCLWGHPLNYSPPEPSKSGSTNIANVWNCRVMQNPNHFWKYWLKFISSFDRGRPLEISSHTSGSVEADIRGQPVKNSCLIASIQKFAQPSSIVFRRKSIHPRAFETTKA